MTSVLILISCDQELSVSKPDPEPQNCRLFLSSNPAGYEIYLNDRIMGQKTPDSLIYLESDEYEITLKHSYYLDTTLNISLQENESDIINLDFTTRDEFYSSINCSTNPNGAEIFLDDSSTGLFTPALLTSLYPGEHKIIFRKMGYWAREIDLLLYSNVSTEVHRGLVDTTIWLIYNRENSDLPTNFITKIGLDLDFPDAFWIGTMDAGVVDLSSGPWVNYNIKNSLLPAMDVTAVQSGSDNKILIGTNYGLVVVKDGQMELFTAENSILPSSIVGDIDFFSDYYPEHEKFYIGLRAGGGLVSYGKNGLEIEENINAKLPSKHISCVKEFRNRLAIGTDDGGILIHQTYGTYSVIYNSENAGFITNKITAIAGYDGIDRIYTAAQLTVPDGNHIGKLYLKDESDTWREISLHDKPIYSINLDFMSVWVGTANGLYKLDSDGNIVKHFTSGNSFLVSNHIYDIKSDRAGNIWLATGGGLVRYKPEN